MRIVQPAVPGGDVLPPLLSAAEFSAGTSGKIPANDPRLEALLAGASAAVRNYCGWHIAPVVEDDYTLDYDGGSLLILRTLRLVDVVSLSVQGQSVDVEGLEWSHNGEVRLLRKWQQSGRPFAGFRAIEATIQHGYDLDAVADLNAVVQQVVGNAISSPLGATREQAGAVSVSWATTAPGVSGGISLLDRDFTILNHYKLPGGA